MARASNGRNGRSPSRLLLGRARRAKGNDHGLLPPPARTGIRPGREALALGYRRLDVSSGRSHARTPRLPTRSAQCHAGHRPSSGPTTLARSVCPSGRARRCGAAATILEVALSGPHRRAPSIGAKSAPPDTPRTPRGSRAPPSIDHEAVDNRSSDRRDPPSDTDDRSRGDPEQGGPRLAAILGDPEDGCR